VRKSITKKGAGGVAQGVNPEFKPKHSKKVNEFLKPNHYL
jgi:hypothetical protein